MLNVRMTIPAYFKNENGNQDTYIFPQGVNEVDAEVTSHCISCPMCIAYEGACYCLVLFTHCDLQLVVDYELLSLYLIHILLSSST